MSEIMRLSEYGMYWATGALECISGTEVRQPRTNHIAKRRFQIFARRPHPTSFVYATALRDLRQLIKLYIRPVL
jgi:hypothetical protein